MKLLISFTFILTLAFTGFGYQAGFAAQCNGSKLSLPAISNLRLGMTRQEILNIYPQANFTKLGSFDDLLGQPALKDPLPNVSAINIIIVNDRVISFTVFYKLDMFWTSSAELANDLTKSLALNEANHWDYLKEGGLELSTLHCKEFYLNAGVFLTDHSYYLSVEDINVIDKLGKETEKQKADFKP